MRKIDFDSLDKKEIKPAIVENGKNFLQVVGEMYPHYDFSEFVYSGVRTKSIVICPEHGPFLTHRSSLLMAKEHPCPECRKIKSRLSVEDVLHRCNKLHDNKYEYCIDSIRNAGWRDNIKIKCSKHGWFFQSKGSHLSGSGCPECYNEQRGDKTKAGVIALYEENKEGRFSIFIENALQKHGDKFDYSKVEYCNSQTEIVIGCPEHGFFRQKPYIHLKSETGCPHCKAIPSFDYIKKYNNSQEGNEFGIFYKVLVTHKKSGICFVKIGITKESVEQRYSRGYEEFDFIIIEQHKGSLRQCAVWENMYKNGNSHNIFYFPEGIVFGKGYTECYFYDETMQLKHSSIQLLRDSILKKQNGVCLICGKVPIRPVLDHSHKKRVGGHSKCRGVICSSCNVFLAKSENNSIRYGISKETLPYILRKMADYLESKPYPYIHPSEKEPPKYLKKSSYNELTKAYRAGKLKKQPPVYPENGKMKLTVVLKRMFEQLNIEPEFYK